MRNSKSVPISDHAGLFDSLNFRQRLIISLVVAIVFMIIIFSLNIATVAKLNNLSIPQPGDHTGTTNIPTTQPTNPSLIEATRIEDAMSHLNELQRIATNAKNTRAINTPGFNQTLDYITNYLTANTNYKIMHQFFPVHDFALESDPILLSSVGGEHTNYTYSNNLSIAQFYYVKYSTEINLQSFVELTVIPNLGCSDEDWLAADPPAEDRIVLIKRGVCTFREKGALAAKYNVTAALFYNDGTATDRNSPIAISLSEENTVPALFLSYSVGQALVDAVQDPAKNAQAQLTIEPKQGLSDIPVGNICADTPTGDITQTIVIGSHSDSVPAGPGINDNGSGSAANLALAVALARLFRTPTYPKYKYRVRFCWWGAEEVGLLGSDYHVAQAKISTVVGERLSDYLINLNYDMLGSPNYFFGIYDGRTAKNDTPAQALLGSNKITDLYKEWFIQQNLPWDYTDFSGRSDYGTFLAEGIVAGGLFSGADDTKTKEQRDRYDQILGQGLGGIPEIIHDPCYHKACDSIQNINVQGYEKMIQAAAYALEFLGKQENLEGWLYPNSRSHRLKVRSY